jgi:hypothetical protein
MGISLRDRGQGFRDGRIGGLTETCFGLVQGRLDLRPTRFDCLGLAESGEYATGTPAACGHPDRTGGLRPAARAHLRQRHADRARGALVQPRCGVAVKVTCEARTCASARAWSPPFGLLADTPQQAVCGQVLHKMQAESRANLVRMAERLVGPVPK